MFYCLLIAREAWMIQLSILLVHNGTTRYVKLDMILKNVSRMQVFDLIVRHNGTLPQKKRVSTSRFYKRPRIGKDLKPKDPI